ncbi:MAG: hypothetical protein ACR2PM_00385 [Hyphomicrobiales bacterium]
MSDSLEPWEDNEAYDRWLNTLREDVIEGEYGYEPGEFNVFPEHWWPLYEKGLTPQQAFGRALHAHEGARREREGAA